MPPKSKSKAKKASIRHKKKKSSNSPNYNQENKIPDKKTSNIYTKIKEYWKHIAAGIFIISTISLYLTFKQQVKDEFSTKEELFETSTYIKGLHIPLEVLNEYHEIKFIWGNSSFSAGISQLEYGLGNPVNFSKNQLKFIIIDGYLYVTATFRDIFTRQVVGKMKYNKWEIRKDGINHFNDSRNNNIELIDKNDFVIFSMQYIYPTTIKLQGYFLDDDGRILVLSDGSLLVSSLKSDKMPEILEAIRNIKPLNTYP